MKYLPLACLFFCWVESKESFIFGNAVVTIQWSVLPTVTTSVRSTCYEIVDVKSCRKKKQTGFFYPYHHVDSDEKMNIPSPDLSKSEPETRYIQAGLTQDSSSSIESSFGETQRNVLTSNSVTTQTLVVSCVAFGSTIPTPPCDIQVIFPPYPASMTLAQYCEVLGDAAQMKVAKCEETTASETSRGYVKVIFTQMEGGEWPSRYRIASNILANLQTLGSSYILRGLPSDTSFEASAVRISSVNIFAAGGFSSLCPNGDLTCGVAGAGTCSADGTCACNSGYNLKNGLCVACANDSDCLGNVPAPTH